MNEKDILFCEGTETVALLVKAVDLTQPASLFTLLPPLPPQQSYHKHNEENTCASALKAFTKSTLKL